MTNFKVLHASCFILGPNHYSGCESRKDIADLISPARGYVATRRSDRERECGDDLSFCLELEDRKHRPLSTTKQQEEEEEEEEEEVNNEG
jgi:hypothetical protein